MQTAIFIMVAVVIVDFVAGLILKRCVVPGLKCESCKKGGDHAQT